MAGHVALGKMKPSRDELTFPHFQTFANVIWDEKGFGTEGGGGKVLWSDVEQVALVFEITPTVAIIEPDTYIGFRLKNPELSVWVHSTFEDSFASEIGRRFAPVTAPRVADGKDEARCIVSYSVWPDAKKGEPLYFNYRKHWWSSDASLAFRK